MTLFQAAALLMSLASVSILFSIAVSQILVGVSLAAFLLSREKLEPSPLWKPLAFYVVWTLLSLMRAGNTARGLPQIKKFYVFVIILVGYTLIRKIRQSEWAVKAMFAAAGVAAVVSMFEFAATYVRLRNEGQEFYLAYTLSRVTGFMGHWMTYSGEQMLVLMILLAWLFSLKQPPRWVLAAGWGAVLLIVIGLLLAFTRGVWLGCLAGLVYLLWEKRRWWILAIPVCALLLYLVAPEWLQRRARSFVPHADDNSVQARLLMYKTGWAMIKDRPFTGVGPDGAQYEFNRYRPDQYLPPAWYGHLHNNYLQIAAERGLPALAAFLWLMAAALRDQIRLARRAASEAWVYLSRGAAAATIAFLAAGFFEYSFGDSEVVMLWFFLLMHGYVARHSPA